MRRLDWQCKGEQTSFNLLHTSLKKKKWRLMNNFEFCLCIFVSKFWITLSLTTKAFSNCSRYSATQTIFKKMSWKIMNFKELNPTASQVANKWNCQGLLPEILPGRKSCHKDLFSHKSVVSPRTPPNNNFRFETINSSRLMNRSVLWSNMVLGSKRRIRMAK